MYTIISQPASRADFKTVKRIDGYEAIKTDYPIYLTDESKLVSTDANHLFIPRDEAELVAVIQAMSAQSIPITIAGSRTGLVGGSVPACGAIVSLERFDRVESLFFDEDHQEWVLRAGAYVSLKSLEAMLKSKRFPDLEKTEDASVRRSYERFKADADTYLYPPDPTEMSASLGGSVVTNASGARTFRFGATRNWVRGLRVVLANGEFIDIPRGKYFASEEGTFEIVNTAGEKRTLTIPDYRLPETKCAAGFFTAPGMDLIDLFIGSEGVLGIVTQVDVALIKSEPKISIVQFLEDDYQAVRLTASLRSDQRIKLDFLEFYSGNALNLLRRVQAEAPSTVNMPPIPDEAHSALFFELNYDSQSSNDHLVVLREIIRQHGADPALSWAAHEPRELERFKVFRHLLPETVNSIIAERKKSIPKLHKLGTDLAVPDEHLMDIWTLYQENCDALNLEWVAFGHIGNNHIHVNILPRSIEELNQGLELYQLFAQKAVEWGGAVSAEHGIGKIKQNFLALMFTPEQISQMQHVKAVFDPDYLLNPGDLFPCEVCA
ncbi:MAG TPA: FAD-binding oxidoreductase [Brevefilum fermentans]|jgi:D-lactate dehydrogenase (cytochrome)|nr:FAD-binding oxidoreductase [Brevefilum fermentans]